MPSSTSSASSKLSHTNHQSAPASKRLDIFVNCYDLLPPGKISSFLWAIGGSLLHSGIVIGRKEFAFGGHNKRGATGVYYTRPRLEPPGGTFRVQILQGCTFRSDEEIDEIIEEASERFQGTSYNLLTKNCNHFTSYLSEKLTGRAAPKWLNRAAGIGMRLPCMVPRDWITPPDYESADGELLDESDDEAWGAGDDDEEEDDENDERVKMLERWYCQRLDSKTSVEDQASWNSEMDRIGGRSNESSARDAPHGFRRARYADNEASRPVTLKDSSGRDVPAAERAPVPRMRRSS